MVKTKIYVDADKRFHLRITQWSYPICDSWTSTSIRHWLLASQPTSKEYCTVCLWEIFNIILYFPVDCLFRVKTVTLETANVTNCHVIATDILFLSSNHRSVQFLYLAASIRRGRRRFNRLLGSFERQKRGKNSLSERKRNSNIWSIMLSAFYCISGKRMSLKLLTDPCTHVMSPWHQDPAKEKVSSRLKKLRLCSH